PQQTARLLGSLPNLHNSWQADCKGRTASRLALHSDVAAHHLAEPFADREAEAGAAVFSGRRCITLGEFLKQLSHLLRRHADAGISDSDANPIAAVFLPMPRINGNGAALRKFVALLIRLSSVCRKRIESAC